MRKKHTFILKDINIGKQHNPENVGFYSTNYYKLGGQGGTLCVALF